MIVSLFVPQKYQEFLENLNEYFSYMMFWLENIIFVLFFVIFEAVLLIPVYVKNIAQIPWASKGLFTSFFNTAIWVFFGIPISLFIMTKDVYNLINILSMLQGCREYQGIKDELNEEQIEEDTEL